MLVIRPSNNNKNKNNKPTHQSTTTRKPITIHSTASTANLPNLSENTVPDLDTASSISTGKYAFNINSLFNHHQIVKVFEKLRFELKFLIFFHLWHLVFIGLWNSNTHTTQWHVTTQPNFITKPKPTYTWEKLPSQPKPKPTKKPIPSATQNELVKRPIATTSTTITTSTSTSTQSHRPKPTEVRGTKRHRLTYVRYMFYLFVCIA